jgi:uncharacterized membrane protein YhfC
MCLVNLCAKLCLHLGLISSIIWAHSSFALAWRNVSSGACAPFLLCIILCCCLQATSMGACTLSTLEPFFMGTKSPAVPL